MTTSSDPRGRLTEGYFARQSALATAASTAFVRRNFYDFSPTPQRPPQDDEVLGGGFANSVDARPAAPDIEGGSARLVWPLDLVQIGWVLAEMLGPPTTTGSGPYVHTFASGGATLPTTTMERKFGSGAFDGAVGLVGRSMQFPLGSDRGFTQVSAEYFARQILDQYSSAISGSPTTPALSARVPRQVGVLKKDGVALGSILSGDLTITNTLGEDRYDGSALVDDVQLEGRSASANLRARFKGAALRDLGKLAVGGYLPDGVELERSWTLSASLSLVLTVRGVRFAKTAPGTGGPGRMDIALAGRGEIQVSDPMITAVLTNSQATYT